MKEILRFSGKLLDWIKLWTKIELSELDLTQNLENEENFKFEIDSEGICHLTTNILNTTYHIPFPTSKSEVSYEPKEKN